MRASVNWWGSGMLWVLLPCGFAGADAASPEAASADDPISVTWEHRKAAFDYVGLTTLYTCTGLEGQVRRILVYLGARKDPKVNAMGCSGGANVASRHAWVTAEFDVPVPAQDGSSQDGAGTAVLRARWRPMTVNARHPSFMGAGDCDLIQDMHDVVVKNFTVRGLDYRTSCFPGTVSLGDFDIKGYALEVPTQHSR